jgi:YidC/Oxa1 family membrane protein insertase
LQYLNEILSQFFQIIHSGIQVIVKDPGYSYGFAIILFTIIIKLLLLPLTIKQTRSQVKMQEMQPKIQEVQKKYKNDPQKAQQEVMKLYKENGANPLGGCLPLLIQMPIIFALFYVFNNLTEIKGHGFLWVPDLYAKDPLYILPILSAITTYLSTALMGTNTAAAGQSTKQMASMNIFMAIFFGFMSLNFKSALVLYWVASNLFQLAQTWLMKRMGVHQTVKN